MSLAWTIARNTHPDGFGVARRLAGLLPGLTLCLTRLSFYVTTR